MNKFEATVFEKDRAHYGDDYEISIIDVKKLSLETYRGS